MTSDSGHAADQDAAVGKSGKHGMAGGPQENSGRSVVSYPISGMVAYGGIGWLIGHWTHIALLFPVGLFVGLALGIALMFYRLGRQ